MKGFNIGDEKIGTKRERDTNSNNKKALKKNNSIFMKRLHSFTIFYAMHKQIIIIE